MLTKATESSKFDDNFAVIKLTKGMIAVIDAEDFEELNKYTWHARKSFSRYYAQRKISGSGKEFWIKMHRQIMNTPDSMIVHHKNRCTMDNRKHNLVNMNQKDHQFLHFGNFPGRLLVKRQKSLT